MVEKLVQEIIKLDATSNKLTMEHTDLEDTIEALRERKVTGETINARELEDAEKRYEDITRDIDVVCRVIIKKNAQLIEAIKDARERRRTDLAKKIEGKNVSGDIAEMYENLVRFVAFFVRVRGHFPGLDIARLAGSVGEVSAADIETRANKLVDELRRSRGPGLADYQLEKNQADSVGRISPEMEADELLAKARAAAGSAQESEA